MGTYHCRNSPAHSTMEGSQSDFLKLLNNKNVELQAATKSRLESVKVMEDGCWQQTVVEYSTKDLNKLPLRDVAVRGSGNADDSFSGATGRVLGSRYLVLGTRYSVLGT